MRSLILSLVLWLPFGSALAADPAQINGLSADWMSMTRQVEHVAQGIQSLAKQLQESTAAEDRLKCILDGNPECVAWVPKPAQ